MLFVGFVFGINGYGFLYVRVLCEMFIVCKIWRFFEKVFGLIKEMLLNWSLIIFMLFRYLKVLFLICLRWLFVMLKDFNFFLYFSKNGDSMEILFFDNDKDFRL